MRRASCVEQLARFHTLPKVDCHAQSLFALDRAILQKVPQPSKPTWVSVQDVVLNSLRPSTQPSQLLPELSHFYQTHKHKESVLLMSLWFLLVCHALTQNDAESPVDIFLSTSQKRSKTHVLTKSLYIKTWFVCLN